MAGVPSQKMDLSDGELSDDDGGPEEDLDTSICKTCNLTFTHSKVSTILFHKIHWFTVADGAVFRDTV